MMTFMMYIILKQKFDSNNNSIKLDKKRSIKRKCKIKEEIFRQNYARSFTFVRVFLYIFNSVFLPLPIS